MEIANNRAKIETACIPYTISKSLDIAGLPSIFGRPGRILA